MAGKTGEVQARLPNTQKQGGSQGTMQEAEVQQGAVEVKTI